MIRAGDIRLVSVYGVTTMDAIARTQADAPVPYPKTTYTPEMLAYYRHRYAERCKDPAYKEKIRQYSRDARARKKALAARVSV